MASDLRHASATARVIDVDFAFGNSQVNPIANKVEIKVKL
jgi:hypothetical protein